MSHARIICAALVASLSVVSAAAGAAVVVRTSVAYRPVYHPVVAPVVHPVAHPVGVVAAPVGVVPLGTVVHTLPPACTSVRVGEVAYQQCGAAWYRPAYSGTTVTYTVVTPPR